MRRNIKLEGIEGLERKLKSLTNATRGEIVNQALEEAGEYFRQDAHDKCPVKGGVSADGFYISTSIPKDPARVGAVRKSIKWMLSKFETSVLIYTNHPIASPLEYGTSREEAKPFMRRAAGDKSTRAGVAGIFKRIFAKAIEKVVR